MLEEIEKRYNSHSIFISGSAAEYGSISLNEAQEFIHLLSRELIKNNFNVVNGFGLGVGSAVVNGALDAIYSNPKVYSEDQLILKPFPQFPTGDKDLKTLWEEYRQNMISHAGISIILFGNKIVGDKVINSDGVKREFEIAHDKGLIPLPIHYTGYMAQEIFKMVSHDPFKYNLTEVIIKELGSLIWNNENIKKSIDQIISIISKIVN